MIDNPRSPRVRAAAKLAKRSQRAETGLFLVEGPQAVDEAVRTPADFQSGVTDAKKGGRPSVLLLVARTQGGTGFVAIDIEKS